MYEADGVDEEVAVGALAKKSRVPLKIAPTEPLAQQSSLRPIDGATLPRVLQETERPENSTTTYTT